MNFLQRAMKYCWRQKIRSIILLVTFTLLSTIALLGLTLSHNTEEEVTNVKESVGASIKVVIDMENHQGSEMDMDYGFGVGTASVYNGDYIDMNIINAISKTENVVGYGAESPESFYGAAKSFKYIPAIYGGGMTQYGDEVGHTVVLNSSTAYNFSSGKYALVSGRHITPEDKHVIMISKELADYNKLSVGDKIHFLSNG